MLENRVLIVDDEQDIVLNLMGIISRALDCTIKTANSFEDGIELLATYNPTLAFIDINLGDGNGFDILKALTKTAREQPKVIMMSAYLSEAEINEAKKTVDFIFMQKPFTKDFVLECINTKFETGTI